MQPESKNCQNCFWFVTTRKGEKCCNAMSPLQDNVDANKVCAQWRDRRVKSSRLLRVDEHGCGA